MKRRLANLPLHGGKAPPWLFRRMTQLAGAVTMAVVDEFGPAEMLRRLADPWWFQAFGCVLGFDWHSSGVTTVTCGALKEAYKHFGADLGIVVAGGKGATSRRAPDEIAAAADRLAVSCGGTAGLRVADECEGRLGRRAGRLSALSSRLSVYAGRPVVRHSARDECRRQNGPPVSLARRNGRRFCVRTARGDQRLYGPPAREPRLSRPPIDAVKHGGGRGRR